MYLDIFNKYTQYTYTYFLNKNLYFGSDSLFDSTNIYKVYIYIYFSNLKYTTTAYSMQLSTLLFHKGVLSSVELFLAWQAETNATWPGNLTLC